MSTNIKGIDVSKWQGAIDWAKVAGDGVKFAMIRLGYGSADGTACGVDRYFQKNVEGALANGIAVGCYFYSYGLSVEAVKKEAAFTIKQLAKYKGKILYPIAYDLEDVSQEYLGKKTLTDMVTAFCSAVEAAGYYATFYSNPNWLTYKLDTPALARFDLWLAQWGNSPTYKGHSYGMWQRSCTGRVAGITGNVDMNTAYYDYEARIKKDRLNGYTGSTASNSGGTASTGTSSNTGGVKVYTVKVGDTLSAIAEKHGATVSTLAEYNKIANPDVIHVGQKIKIPTVADSGASVAFKVGDKVKCKPGVTKFASGAKMASFVPSATLYVRAVESDGKILLVSTEPKKNVFTGRVKASDMKKI